MKRAWLGFPAAAAAVLAGCVVSSVCPFYTQKDLVFEPALVGNWIKSRSDHWSFEKSSDLAYRLTIFQGTNATVLHARAFKLQDQLFLDLISTEHKEDLYVIPVHILLRVWDLTPAVVRMSPLDHEWLMGLLEKKPLVVRHQILPTGNGPEDKRIVLTASTAELQKFVVSHLNTSEAWKESFELQRETPKAKFDAIGGTLTAR